MTPEMLSFVTLTAALGCGLMAGLFFAISVCVMWALGRLRPAEDIAAMQSINVTTSLLVTAVCNVPRIWMRACTEEQRLPWLFSHGRSGEGEPR